MTIIVGEKWPNGQGKFMGKGKTIRWFQRFVSFLKGSNTEYDLTTYRKALVRINNLDSLYKGKSERDILTCFNALKGRAQESQDLSSVVIEAFAIIRESIRRELGLDPYEEQILAGLAMLDGKIVDMKTGEGKTLAVLFPICTSALMDKGVQVLTFNDYLARRDVSWAAGVFSRLGFSSSYIQQNTPREERIRAYSSDICYLTAKEFGFDYLRDGNCRKLGDRAQREFYFVFIDEADSILIDEARSPLIIAEGVVDETKNLNRIVNVVQSLNPNSHLIFDEHNRNVSLSEEGVKLLENELNTKNFYDQPDSDLIIQIQYAIQAQFMLSRNIDYIVVAGEVKIVDEFTGRSAENRRWPDGLHDAVEAKERISKQQAASMIDSISLYDLFRLVPKLSGMSGTAIYSANEFQQFYHLEVAVIPTHEPCRRIDLEDRIFSTLKQKNDALVEDIREKHTSGRPVLVGTSSISESAHIATLLKKRDIPYRLLNALNDYEEASIVKNAGCRRAVTISTNMAGRGTDIVLGNGDSTEKKEIEDLGGLYVIGTNRHESVRIDNQLRGRAGRQGDKGSSRYYTSLEDPLFVKFGFRNLIEERLPSVNDMADQNGEICSTTLNGLVAHLQSVIDGENFEIKKTLSRYSSFKEIQRLHIRNQKDELLLNSELSLTFFQTRCESKFNDISLKLSSQSVTAICRTIMLSSVEKAWSMHLGDLSDLQSSISLRGMGGRQPFLEFQREASQWFIERLAYIEVGAMEIFESLVVKKGRVNLEQFGVLAPSSTWTYQINDEMFSDMRDALMRQPGLAAGLALYGGPLFLLSLWLNSKRKDN